MADSPRLPGYRIQRELGRGGMATVYLALQEKLQREVAVKILSPQFSQDGEFTARFVKEAETAAKLHHSSIIPIYDVGESGSVRYIVMEYLQGTLKARTQKGPLDPQAALRILWQMADALAYAHDQGFVHRDIKPENIMFRQDGTAVLTDFGIAKAANAAASLTRPGTSIGSPHYMSPEQARGEKVDGRSDIYSLGAVLYEMLTGRVPYQASDVMAIMIKHMQEPLPALPRNLAHFQPGIDRMMAKRKEDRPQNAHQLKDLVSQLWPGTLPEQAGAPSPGGAPGARRPTGSGGSATARSQTTGGWLQSMAPEKKRLVVPLLAAILVTLAVIIILLIAPLNKGGQSFGGVDGPPTWVQVFSDGNLIHDDIRMPGELLTVDCQSEFLISTGNAGGFTYTLNGQNGKTLGEAGATILNIRITLAAYRAFLQGH